MLQQNWFYQAGMTMVGENPDQQLFFDDTSKCFYVVYDEWVEKASDKRIALKQYEPNDIEYEKLMSIKKDYEECGDAVYFICDENSGSIQRL
jgi:hypothetical protein